MGDFSEHILFGLLTAVVVAAVSKNFLSLNIFESALSVIAVVVGSLLPDIDHKNSYIHRSVKSFVSLAAGLAMFLLPLSLNLRFLLAMTIFLAIYTAISGLKIKHRGFTHSFSFCAIVTSIVVVISVLIIGRALPGTALGLGLLSHLLLDGEFKLE